MSIQNVCGMFIGSCPHSCYANLKLKTTVCIYWLYLYIVQLSKWYHKKAKSAVGGHFAIYRAGSGTMLSGYSNQSNILSKC